MRMKKAVPVLPGEPALSAEQKLEIRNRQLQIVSLQEQLRVANQSLVNYVKGTLIAMKLDNQYDIDSQTLNVRKVALTGVKQ